MSSYIEGFEDGVRATKAEYLKLLEEDTHPAKTLTDEEIINIAKEHIHQRLEGERFGYVDFARAILKKAQENG